MHLSPLTVTKPDYWIVQSFHVLLVKLTSVAISLLHVS